MIRLHGTSNERIACYCTSLFKASTRTEKWTREFLVQHGAHKELSKLFLFWKEDAIVLGWILSAFNNIACSDQVRNDLLDDDLVKNVCDLLRSGKFSNNEFNLQTAIHALGNFIYQNEEAALCVAKFLGSEPEKIILSESLKTFIEKGFDSSSNSLGQPFMYPQNNLNYASNFLNMTFGLPTENKDVDQTLAKAMDKILILHADHEQNASTSTVRLAGSSGANPFACIASGIACLWGPAHGGANEACIKMLEEIGNVKKIPEFVKRAKDKDDPFRLMGFGHRVYKNFDPRAKVMQKICHEVLDHLGIKDDPLLAIAVELEKIALEDEYFIEKKLYPNIDFYSGIVMKSLGFPMDMFTVLFAVGRTVGWVSQWNEMIEDTSQRIGRPRQLYVGNGIREYIDIHKR